MARETRGIAAGTLAHIDGKYAAFMAEHGADAMLVRPDFHLYGAVADAAA